jgi:hypothetical protein
VDTSAKERYNCVPPRAAHPIKFVEQSGLTERRPTSTFDNTCPHQKPANNQEYEEELGIGVARKEGVDKEIADSDEKQKYQPPEYTVLGVEQNTNSPRVGWPP